MTAVQLLILKVRAAHSASDGSMGSPAGSKHSQQHKLLVVSDIVFQERLFPESNELLHFHLFSMLLICKQKNLLEAEFLREFEFSRSL